MMSAGILAKLITTYSSRQVRGRRLARSLDEKAARLHFAKIDVKLTQLRPDQASYIGVPTEGPFKPDHYRY